MRHIRIGGCELPVKDYHCMACGMASLPGGDYLPKDEMRLRLYVNVTDRCNAGCPFCVSDTFAGAGHTVDPERYAWTLERIRAQVSGVSFTGGEPLLHPALLDELIGITDSLVDTGTEIDMVTNGTNLHRLPFLKRGDRLTTIHISRHHDIDDRNRALMRWNAPGCGEIQAVMRDLYNSSRVVFNCVLQKGGIETVEDVRRYLEHSIALGVRNNSFITMFQANEYCREHMISAALFPFVSDAACDGTAFADGARLTVWNRHRDHAFCSCLSGDYRSRYGITRFYFRCPGTDSAPSYCRQLVYSADNHLQDGFGSGRKLLIAQRDPSAKSEDGQR